MARTVIAELDRAFRLLVWMGVVLAAGLCARAQSSSQSGTPAESKGGASFTSIYAQDKIETVNLANGNLSLNIPLATLGGRGPLSYTVALSYNSKLWSTKHEREWYFPAEQVPSATDHYKAIYDEPNGIQLGRLPLGAGWFISDGPALKVVSVNIDPVTPYSICFGPVASEEPPCGYKYILTKMWLVLPDGSEVELRDSLTEGAPALSPIGANNVRQPIDRDRGRVWHSTDGSAITLILDQNQGPTISLFPSGWVFLADGTRLRIVEGECQKMIDSNGNFISFGTDPNTGARTYTDQLGRQVSVQGGTSSATITVRGYAGTSDRLIQINTGVIGAANASGIYDNLRADFRSLPRPFTTGDALKTNNEEPIIEHTIAAPHTDLFLKSEGADNVDERTTVTSVSLLDGRSIRFRYNQYGEVAEIVYPGGGVSQIDYEGGPSKVCGGLTPFNNVLDRRVVQRRTLTNATDVDATWLYTHPGSAGAEVVVEAHQGAATGPLLMSESHFFLARNSQYALCGPERANGTGYEKWENSKEYRVERQTGTGTVTTVRQWEQRAPVVWANDPGSNSNAYAVQHGQEQPPNDPRVAWEETTLENGKKKRTEYGYDRFNNVTSAKEYDLGQPNGAAGPLLREIVRQYAGSGAAPAVNGLCYTNLNAFDASCGGGLNADINAVVHNRRLLLSEKLKDGEGNQEAYTDFEYDNYSVDLNHAALIINPGMAQYDGGRFTLFPSQFEPRANMTQVRKWVEASSYVTSYKQYDNAGNTVRVKDSKGNVSNVSYADNFGDGSNPEFGAPGANGATFAMPTTETNALGHEIKTQYNYSLGVPTGVRDANGVLAKSEYDGVGRPVRITSAAGLAEQAVSEMSYPSAGMNILSVSKQLDATRWLASRTEFDGFDRPVLESSAEDGQHASTANLTLFSKTVYDALGRVKFATNPYRSTPASTDGWTRTLYDLAGHVVEVASFAGAPGVLPPATGTNADWTGSAVTIYDGDRTTFRDPAGKQRRHTVDGIGRLKAVEELLEDPSTTVYATTSYTYDARGNVKNVNQGAQVRSFVYDGLSRLLSATNPESGTATFQYDLNGNLEHKTDARSIRTDYSYDALNRLTARSYTDGTPAVAYSYDTASIAFSKGRMTSVTSTVSAYNYTGFDAAGRIKSSSQTTDGQTYTMAYSYDKAGNLTSQTYPSGKVLVTEMDDAGRVAGVRKQGGGFYAGGASSDADNRIRYAAQGDAAAVKLGNGLWEHTLFNSRLQPTQIGLGASSDNSGLLKLDYTYGATNNNGNLQSQTIAIPSGPTLSQTYTYDALNRVQTTRETTGATETWKQKFSYDLYGNRTIDANETTASMVGPNPSISTTNNRIAAAGYVYDSAGNLISTPGPNNSLNYDYDAENLQTAYRYGPSTEAVYAYDGDGRRVKKTVNMSAGALATIYVYNSMGQLVAEYANQTGGEGVSYLTQDYLGSTRLVSDSAGQVKSRHDFLPFGEEILTGKAPLSGRSEDQKYRAEDKDGKVRQKFTGYERDNETGLDYAQARYYSSTHGRFTSVDPLPASMRFSNPQTLNRYSYALNNPLRFFDPDGEETRERIREAHYEFTVDDRNEQGELIHQVRVSVTERRTELVDERGNVVGLLSRPEAIVDVQNTGQGAQDFSRGSIEVMREVVRDIVEVSMEEEVSAQDMLAFGIKESLLGVGAVEPANRGKPEKQPSVNPLQLSGSSNNRPNTNRRNNIRGAIEVYKYASRNGARGLEQSARVYRAGERNANSQAAIDYGRAVQQYSSQLRSNPLRTTVVERPHDPLFP